jgi:hypothetical protein
MSAVPFLVLEISTPRVADGQLRPRTRSVSTQFHEASRVTASPNWRLTDRGIAAVMVIAAVLVTVAVVVIGLTAVRVTDADYDPSRQQAPQVRH